jgi:uncharacterized membrane protein (DUF485 family)
MIREKPKTGNQKPKTRRDHMDEENIRNSTNDDFTPTIGAARDVAPLDHPLPKPAHEMTADEDFSAVNWKAVAQMPEFKLLLKTKKKFVVPATLFFVVYYFALPVLVGYSPGLMSRKVMGVVNIAYLFALSQFFMAWIIAAMYLRAASRFDKMEEEIVEKVRERQVEEGL